MHGLIFNSLKLYAAAHYGPNAWKDWLQVAMLSTYKMYLPGVAYPDTEIVSILSAATRVQRVELADLLTDFGVFITPELLTYFPRLIDPKWKTLDLIEHTEEIIHTVVRKEIPGAEPPRLAAARKSPTAVQITYTSPRKLCPLLKGIVMGLGKHFGETVTITEDICMLIGDSECRVLVELTPGSPA